MREGMVAPRGQRSHYRCRVSVLNENQEVVALAMISLGLRRRLRLGIRGIADGLGQHLAQLSLGLLSFGLLRFPVWGLCHAEYLGMPEAELNPLKMKGWQGTRPSPPFINLRCNSQLPLGRRDRML